MAGDVAFVRGFSRFLWRNRARANPNFEAKSWSVEEGLLHPYVSALLQSTDGYLWIGTYAGLARFDGTKLKVFSRANTEVFAGGDTALCLAEDKLDQSLWIGTTRGVVHLKDGAFRLFTSADGLDPSYLHVRAITAARDGGVWAQSGENPCRITAAGKIIPWHALMPPHGRIEITHSGALLEDPEGKLWQANNRGVFVADFKARTYQTLLPPTVIGAPFPRELFQARDGAIYWLNGNSLACYRTNTLTVFTNELAAELSGIAEDWRGNIWIGGSGLFQFSDDKFFAVKVQELKEAFIGTLTFDDQGHLWVGTRDRGFYRIKIPSYTHYTTADGLLHNQTWAVRESRRGGILICTDAGINRFEDGKMTVVVDAAKIIEAIAKKQEYIVARDARIENFVEREDGSIDFSKNGHPFRVTDGVVEFHPPPRPPSLVLGEYWQVEDEFISRRRNGEIVAWTSAESFVYLNFRVTRPEISEWRTNQLKTAHYLGGLRSRTGAFWCGSWQTGVHRFQGEEVKSWTIADRLASNAAMPVHEAEDGSIWIATEKGLSRWKDGKFRNLGIEHGLNYGAIVTMLDDGLGFYWMGAHRAVFRIPKRNLTEVADNKEQRLAINVVGPPAGGLAFPSAFKSKSGELWFASWGVLRFNPHNVNPPRERPTIIEEVVIDGEKIEGDRFQSGTHLKGLMLPAGLGKIVRIEFTRRNFASGQKTQFHHRLRGHSQNWILAEAGEAAQYIGLRPGQFEFEVAAESPLGGWSSPAIFKFGIEPHFYETKLFYGLCVIGGLFTFSSIYGVRLRNSRRIYRLESENAVSKERERIAADMHDVLGSTLTKIGLQTELINQRRAHEKPTADDIQNLRRTVRDAVSELDEVIWLFTDSEGSLPALVEHLQAYAEDFLEPSGLRLHARSTAEIPSMLVSAETRSSIVRIVREALNNAIKHAHASHIWLTIDIDEGNLRLVIRDDGCGIKNGHGPTGNGRTRGFESMRKRVEDLKGQLIVDQHEGAGTRITARLPLKNLEGTP